MQITQYHNVYTNRIHYYLHWIGYHLLLMIMNLLIIQILATLVSFIDTKLMVLPSSESLDSNCCVDVAKILAEFHRQSDPRSNQHVIAAGRFNQHPYESPTLLTKAEISPTYLFQHVASAPKTTTQREYCSGLLDERIEEHSKVSPAYYNITLQILRYMAIK